MIRAQMSDETKDEIWIRRVKRWRIRIEEVPFAKVMKDSIKSYNRSLWKKRTFWKEKATMSKDQQFLERIVVNYVRHNLVVEYNQRAKAISTKSCADRAYLIFNKRVYDEIARQYPALKEECDRQLETKQKEVLSKD